MEKNNILENLMTIFEELISNKVAIVVGIIFLVCIIIGLVRGFVRIVASLAATIAIVVVVTLATPFVGNVIMKVTPIEEIAQKKCAEILLADQSEDNKETEDNIKTEDNIETEDEEQEEYTKEEQITLLENAKIPEIFRQMLLENNNGEVYELLGVTTFVDYVGSYLARMLSNIAAFLLTWLIVTIIVRTILYMLGIISDLPLIGGINRLAGGALGLGMGLVIVWILFIAITLAYDTEIGKSCFENIQESSFLTFLYNNNILLRFVTKFRV